MPLRDVVITATVNERLGDETFELWLKRGTGPWLLEDTGATVAGPTQDFEILGLEEMVEHVMQLRMKRAGRYRIGYLTADPDTWPAQSRYEFTPGLSANMGAPVLTAISWARTSASLQTISVDVTPDDNSLDIQILRNGTVIDTVSAPHSGAFTYADENPPQGVSADHEYTARHSQGFIVGPLSNEMAQWPGPPAPTNLEDTSVLNFYEYTVGWVNSESGASTRLQDDYSQSGTYVNRHLAIPGATSGASGQLPKSSSLPSNGNLNGTVGTRIRHEWTQFGVTDNSNWTTLPDTDPDCVVIQYSADETLYDDNRPF